MVSVSTTTPAKEDGENITVSLLQPDGAIVLLNQSAEQDRAPFTLSGDGTYYLLLKNNAAAAADVSFSLTDLAAVTPIAFDTPFTNTLSPGRTSGLFRFTGIAGQRLVFDSQTTSTAGNWILYGPTNQFIGGTNLSFDFEVTLPSDGTYVLVLDGASATDIPYTFNIVTPVTTTTALSLNTPVSGTITEPGEQDIYTFTGSPGQRLYYDALKNDLSDTIRARLVDPQGNSFLLNQDADGDRNLFTLSEAGTYQLILESNANGSWDTGSYNFQLLDVAAAPSAVFDTPINGSLSPGRETDLYRFTGTAGQRLVFDSQTTSTAGTWNLYGPTNQFIGGTNLSFDFEVTLPSDGVYALLLDGASATDLPYSFNIVTPVTTTTALSLNTPVSGTITEPGEQDIYTFTGSPGQRLYYDALKNDLSDTIFARLVDPTGNFFVLNQQADSDRNLFTLSEAGTYQLILESTVSGSWDTGSYNFQLLDLAAAPSAVFDTPINGSLSPGRETDLYRFTGTAGQRLVFDSQTTSTAGNWNLYGPTNQFIGGTNLIFDFEVTLPSDGVYALLLDGASATDLPYSFNIVTPVTSITGSPSLTVNDASGFTNSPIPLSIAASFASSDGNDLRSILISGVPSGASLSAGTNNGNGSWTLTPAQLIGLSITPASAANFALTITASGEEATGDAATTAVILNVTVNTATGVTITPTSGLVTTEAGGSATFTVVLDSQPTGNVTIGLSSSDLTEGTLSTSSLTFTPTNWDTPQTVIVTGVDDSVIDGNIPYTIITAPATSTDPNYNNLNPADVSVTNNDNDIAAFIISPTTGLFTSEAGGQASFSVRLTSQPTANVTIGISSSDTSEGTVSTSSLTFTPANWNINQAVTITGVDDPVFDGNVAYSIITGPATSSDGNFNGVNPVDVSVTNLDNDVPGVTVTPTAGLVTTENGGTASFTVVLNTQPTANVVIGLSSSDTTEGTLSTSSLTFTAANWNVAQSVTVTGIDDAIVDGNIAYSVITAAAVSTDANYNGFNAADVSLINNDNDAASLSISNVIKQEGNSGSTAFIFNVILNNAVQGAISVDYATADGSATLANNDYQAASGTLIFTGSAGETRQITVNVTGDSIFEPNEEFFVNLSNLQASGRNVTLSNAQTSGIIVNDDAAAGITVTPTAGLVTTENGGTASFSVVLNSQPTADVVIGLSSSDTTEGTLSTSSLTFTAANWNVAQSVTVTGVDDAIVDGNIAYSVITAAAVSSDAAYSGFNADDVSLINNDNDTAGITVTPTAGLVTTENGGTASFSVVLNSQPTADVVIGLSSSDTTEGTLSTSSLTFTAANWNVAQSVTVTGVDDAIVDGNIAYSVITAAAVSSDAAYSGFNAADVSLINNDNDTAGITVTPTAGLVTTENGGTASFSVVLNSQPTADVVIGLSSSDTTEGTLSTSSLTFTAANWNVAQSVTVTGVDDAIVDGNIAYSVITAAAVSSDAAYSGFNAADVSLINNDNDTAGITVTPTAGLVTTENGGTASFSVVLNSQPTADVVIGLSSSDTTEGTLSTSSLTFTAANWNVAQSVTVTGVDDAIVDGNIAYSVITAAAVSSDAAYSGFNADDVSLINNDNDTAGITVTPTAGLVTTENGGTASFSVVLNSQPTADVVIGLSSSDTTEGTLSTSSLTFTAANWNVAQTVTVTGVDDAIVDGNIAYSVITAAAVSSDAAYSGFNADDVSLINNDNDTAGITVTPTAGLVTTENGGTASFSVVLNSQPTADVVIGLSSSDTTEGTLSTSSLTFTAANWNVAQSVTVTGVDDAIVDGNIAYSVITAAAVSSDAAYSGFNADDVSLINNDNDTAGITVTPTAGLVTTENGGTASFSVVLNSQPTADVVIGLSSSDTTEGTLSTSSLTFTAANWNVAQSVTVTGVDDAIVDGNIAYSVITAAAVSSDAAYSGFNADDVSLINNDNDVSPTSLGDRVFLDANANGLQDAGESGVAGATVALLAAGSVIATTATDANGNYLFSGLTPGDYQVRFFAPTGFGFTAANAGSDDSIDSDADPTTGLSQILSLAAGENNPTVDAGLVQLPPPVASLGDRVFLDANANGLQDAGESGVAGATVALLAAGSVIATTATDANGNYLFSGLTPGDYQVQFFAPTGFGFTAANAGSDDSIDSDADPTTGLSQILSLAAGENNPTVDAGLRAIGQTITGTRKKDTLTGTPGDDVITGLKNRDLLTGGEGADRFVYTSIVDGGDTIIDFNPLQGDKVDLTGALRSVGYTGTTPIADGYLKFMASGSNNSILQIDPDGLGPATAKSFILFRNVSLATLSNPDNFIAGGITP